MDNVRRIDNWQMRERHQGELDLVTSHLDAVSDFCIGIAAFAEKRKTKTTTVPSIPTGDDAA